MILKKKKKLKLLKVDNCFHYIYISDKHENLLDERISQKDGFLEQELEFEVLFQLSVFVCVAKTH